MRKYDKNNFGVTLLRVAILIILLIFVTNKIVIKKKALGASPADNPLVIAQITDEHIQTGVPLRAQRLREVLLDIKNLKPDVFISTGDHIETTADTEAYFAYRNLINEIGFPNFKPIAGNHDGWTSDRFGEYRGILSYVVGNYRFIGFSDNLMASWPQEAIEAEMRKSCADGKPIVLYHHFAPYGWWNKPQAIDRVSWEKLNTLAQKYPVILYLAGHSHEDNTQAIGSYLAHTGARTELGQYSGFVLSGNHINEFGRTNKPIHLLISEPSTYFEGLDFTKTKSGPIKIRAMVKPKDGAITRVTYAFDSQTPANMTLTGNLYSADLNAANLSGLHNLTITAFHSSGSWGTVSQTIPVFFSPQDYFRFAPACGSLPISPTTVPQPTLIPTATPTASTPTFTPTPTAFQSSQNITLWGFVKDRNNNPVKNAGLIINKVAGSSCSGEQSGCFGGLLVTNQQGYWEAKCNNAQEVNCLKIVEKEPSGYANCRINPLAQISGAGIWNYNTIVIKKPIGGIFSSTLGPITFFNCRN